MRIYLAGLYTNACGPLTGRLYNEMMNDRERAARRSCRYLLESFHYMNKQAKVDTLRVDEQQVFMDSGAFSAFTLGSTIDINEYCQYLKTNGDLISVSSVLDGIGDPLKTYANQCIMEQLGTRPLPCFHWGEDERYLQHYVDNYEYITLGGMVPHSSAENKLWLDRIWSKYLCTPEGHPRLKVHGFGMTSLPLMKRYPWFSVDSSSWVQIASMGNIYIPKWGTISVSDKSPARKVNNQHVETFTGLQKDAIVAEIEARGFSYERLRSLYVSRWMFNVDAYNELCRELESKELRLDLKQQVIF